MFDGSTTPLPSPPHDIPKRRRTILFLLGGEGWDEGGVSTILEPRAKARVILRQMASRCVPGHAECFVTPFGISVPGSADVLADEFLPLAFQHAGKGAGAPKEATELLN